MVFNVHEGDCASGSVPRLRLPPRRGLLQLCVCVRCSSLLFTVTVSVAQVELCYQDRRGDRGSPLGHSLCVCAWS